LSLQYPLHPGAGWIMRPEDDPFLITRNVEGREVLDLPFGRLPAWRINHDLPGFFGPNDYAHFWFGREGFYGYRLHVEADWTDASGERLGTYIGDESEMLTEANLVEN
ncbi:MAG: hypothetical protein FD129_451, partial [bacterium]